MLELIYSRLVQLQDINPLKVMLDMSLLQIQEESERQGYLRGEGAKKQCVIDQTINQSVDMKLDQRS